MGIFVNILADSGAVLLLLTSAIFATLLLSLIVLFLLPPSGQATRQDISSLLMRLFSISALLQLAGVTKGKAVAVFIVVAAIYLSAFGWAGKRAVDIVTGNSAYTIKAAPTEQVETPPTPVELPPAPIVTDQPAQ